MSGELRKLSEQDRAEMMAFFHADPYYALFFTGNLLAMGLEHEDLDYWGLHDENGNLSAVLMRYMDNWSALTSDEALDLTPFIEHVNRQDSISRLTGKSWIAERMLEGLTNFTPRKVFNDYFCSLQKENFHPDSADGVFRLTLADQEAFHELYAGEEFAHITGDTLRRRLTDSGCRAFAVEQGGRLVSAGMTIVETPVAAMVGSVFTKQAERGKGHASRIMSVLCAELLAEGKEPCLFYDNPSAGVIYRRLGFQDIGQFKMIDFLARN